MDKHPDFSFKTTNTGEYSDTIIRSSNYYVQFLAIAMKSAQAASLSRRDHFTIRYEITEQGSYVRNVALSLFFDDLVERFPHIWTSSGDCVRRALRIHNGMIVSLNMSHVERMMLKENGESYSGGSTKSAAGH